VHSKAQISHTEVREFLKYPIGHSLKHWLDLKKMYPERHEVQLVEAFEQVLHGCEHNEHTLPIP